MGEQLEKMVAFRMSEETLERIQQICKDTGMTRSQVIRHLVNTASVRPAIIRTEVLETAQPATANGAG